MGPDREWQILRSHEKGGARRMCDVVVSHPVYAGRYLPRMINLPSRFEPPSYRRGYFNILKFHPKRAVYQNLRHKLHVATLPPFLASPADILHAPRCRDSVWCSGRHARFALALSFGDVGKLTIDFWSMPNCLATKYHGIFRQNWAKQLN